MKSFACAVAALALVGGASAAAPPRSPDAIVRAWSARLSANDYAGLAALFRLPAVVVQGPYAYRLQTARQVRLWHRALPCGSTVVSVRVRGRFATAVFKLANRRGSRCDAPGMLAAARFTIVDGKIVGWMQVP